MAMEEQKDDKKETNELVSTLQSMGYDKKYILRAIEEHKTSKLYISEYINVSILVDIIIQLQEKDNLSNIFHPHFININKPLRLKINDTVDYRLENGHFILCRIIGKKINSNKHTIIKLHSFNKPISDTKLDRYCNINEEYMKLAIAKSISFRKIKCNKHIFSNIAIDDYIDINPIYRIGIGHRGWKPGRIIKFDTNSSQIKALYKNENDNIYYSYWVHLENINEVSEFKSKYKEINENISPSAINNYNNINMNLYGKSTEDFVDAIRQTCIDNMIILCKLTRDMNNFELLQQLSIDLYTKNIDIDDEKCSNMNNTLKMVANIICNKWRNCPIIRTTYKSMHNLMDNYENMRYFYSKIDEIMHRYYIPNMEDIKRYKISETFVINKYNNYTNSFDNGKTIQYNEKDATKLFTLPLFSNANIGFAIEIPDIFLHRFVDPINKNPFVIKLQVAKIFKSKTKPYLIDCYVTKNKKIMLSSRYILKRGDDMRYDYCVLQLFNKMNNIWKRNGLNTHCITYECIPIGNNIGIIEIIENCVELNKILELKEIFLKEPHKFYKLIDTAVGAFIGLYVCGVRDRHYDNILVNKSTGDLFNIDFGYVFGAMCNLNEYKMPITKELKHVFGIYEFGWHTFCWNACKAWLMLRQNAKELIDFGLKLFDFDDEYKKSNKIKEFMTDSLKLNMTSENAEKYIYEEMDTSVNSIMTKMKNTLHDWENWLK